ncbi:hypothetical protein C8R44DRAFT_629022, partial [Mycena epipterygia]
PIVDAQGRIVAVLAGQPRDPTYAAAVENAYALITEQASLVHFPAALSHHRRGPYPTINIGLAYAKGQRAPSWLHAHSQYTSIVERLIGEACVQRLATYASAAFRLWAPRLYFYYKDHNDTLHAPGNFPHLRRMFAKSVFSSATFNFGPNVWTYKHRDVLNLPFGWCAVLALGLFDPTKGGHLVLWDLELIIEFPAGATILLPSATIAHSNIPVQAGDSRASFTQYTGGGLLRYIDNGFRTEAELQEEDPEEYARRCAEKDGRWEMGLGLFSTIDEILEDVQPTA